MISTTARTGAISVDQILESIESHGILEKFNGHAIESGYPFACEQIHPIKKYFGQADARLASFLAHEFARFVWLRLNYLEQRLSPSGPVDMLWHFIILHTGAYASICDHLCQMGLRGDLLSTHTPPDNPSAPDTLSPYERTIDLYIEHFGKPEPFVNNQGESIPVWSKDKSLGLGGYSG